MSKPRLIDFKDEVAAIQKFADEECDGNFSMAVRMLCRTSLINR